MAIKIFVHINCCDLVSHFLVVILFVRVELKDLPIGHS